MPDRTIQLMDARGGGSGGFVKILLVLALATAAFLGWTLFKGGALVDRTSAAGRVESSMDDVLAGHGVTDLDIRNVVRSERRARWPLPSLWVETQREVDVDSIEDAAAIIEELKAVSKNEHRLLFVTEAFSDKKAMFECGDKGRIFQRIIFIVRSSSRPARKVRPGSPVAAIVIDDVAGRPSDVRQLDDFLSLGIPITFAVLPHERVTKETAEKIHKAGHEIIVHQPMEPGDMAHNNPGKAAVLSTMTVDQVGQKVLSNFTAVPHAVGLSNHMGSKFTADPRAMGHLLRSMKNLRAGKRPVFFFDSHTAIKPVSAPIAQKEKVPSLTNDIFLDNVDNPEDMERQLEFLKKRAQRNGSAAGIGHIQRKHMASSLRKMVPMFKKDGVRFVYLSELLESRQAAGAPAKNAGKPKSRSRKT